MVVYNTLVYIRDDWRQGFFYGLLFGALFFFLWRRQARECRDALEEYERRRWGETRLA